MFLPFLRVFGLTIAALLVSATPALADIDTAAATTTCSTYSLSVSASGMLPATSNSLLYIINVSPVASGFPITGEIDFVASESGTFSDTITGSFPALAGSYTFSGTATLVGPNKGGFPTQEISF
jgi:hypothetical protein